MQPTPLCPAHLLVADVSIWATSLLALAVRCIFCGFFFFFSPPSYIALWDSQLPTDPSVRGFLTVWKFLLHDSLPRMGPSLTLLSLFLLFIFCPTSFQREWAAFLGAWCPPPAYRYCFVEVVQYSNDLLMNLWGRKWSPSPIPLPSWDHPQTPLLRIDGKQISNSGLI